MPFKLKNTDLDILKSLSFIIDIDEESKLFHSWRVAVIAKWLSDKVCKKSSLALYVSGLLHDIGTFDITDFNIHYKDKAKSIKSDEVRTHPQKGAGILAYLSGFIPIAKIVLDHHEWMNGEGYPRGLKGYDISIESQIIRLSDKCAFIAGGDNKNFDELLNTLELNVQKEYPLKLFNSFKKVIDKEKWDIICNTNLLTKTNESIFSNINIGAKKSNADPNLIKFFGKVLDAKHAYTEGHSQRVSYFSVLIALSMNLSDKMIQKIEIAAFLHDIGKLGIPKSILDKTSDLTKGEFDIIKTHATLSFEIVKGISSLRSMSNMVGSDQEHWDGTGYPYGLKGEKIPIGSRIIFVADAFDAITTNRSYSRAKSVGKAIKVLNKNSGILFDPQVVDVASKIFAGFKNSSIIASYNS